MRKSRKLLSLLLCFALVLTMMPITVFAAGGASNVSFEVSDSEVTIGEEITVVISYNDMTVSSFTTAFAFDNDLLECTSIVGPNPSRPSMFYITSDPMDPWASYQATAVSSVSEANANGTVGIAFAGTVDTAYVANPVMTVTFKTLGEGDAVFTFTEDTAGADFFRGEVGTDTVTILPLPEMTGSVAITGTDAPAYGDTLNAVLSEDFASDGELSYQWKRDGVAIAEATGTSYTLVKEDIGSVITVEVTSTGNSGSKTASTAKVEKAVNANTPQMPEFVATATTITYTVIEGQEVSLDPVAPEVDWVWENDGVFDNLTPNTLYRISVRIAETDTHKASNAAPHREGTKKLEQVISTPHGTAVNVKIGKTIDLNDYFSSNAVGAQLTFTVNGEPDADGMLEVGSAVGTEYTVTASSGELNQYYAAEDAAVTITTIAKSESAFKDGFAGTVEKLATDANFTKAADKAAGDGAVTYSSNNAAVASVDAATGEVTIVGRGEAVITAAIAETEEYASASVSYTLTVYGVADVDGIAITAPVKYEEPQTSLADGEGYQGGAIVWSPAVSENKFAGETVYTATVELQAKDGFRFPNGAETYVHSETFPVTAGYDALGGTVTISGDAVYGQTLTAVTSELNYGAEEIFEPELSYQWYRGETPISGAEAASYELVKEDIGKTIKVAVSNKYNNGSVFSDATEEAAKAPAEAAASAAVLTVTADSITVTNVSETQEYAIAEGAEDAGAWKSGEKIVFEGLKADTEYVVSTRVKETATHFAGAVVRTDAVTDKLIEAPVIGDITPVKYGTPVTAVAETDSYTGTITWSPAAEKFAANTVYTATVTLTAKDGYRFSKSQNLPEYSISEDMKTLICTQTFAKTADLDPLTGTIEIVGDAVCLESLYAECDLDYGSEESGKLHFQWYRNGSKVGMDDNMYRLTAADLGAKITVEVWNENNTGKLISAPTAAVVKAEGEACEPVAPENIEVTADSITVKGVWASQECSIDGQNWFSRNEDKAVVFEGLEADTEYTVYVRFAETEDTFAGDAASTAAKTLKLAQVLTAVQSEVPVKIGKTLDLDTMVSSNAEGAVIVYTIEGTLPEGTAFADGVITAGTAVGEFTVKANAAAVGKYYAAEEITLTVKITEKDEQIFDDTYGFTAATVKTYGDPRFGKSAELKVGDGAITYTSSNEAVAIVDETGGITIVGVGETVITATAAETADFAEAKASYTLTVNKKALEVPAVSGTYAYTGEDQTVTLTGFDAETMEVSGNVGKNAAAYTAEVTLKDTANYEWADGTIEAKSIEWTIAKAKVTGAPAFTKINTSGKTLADAPITAGTITVEGTVAWDDAAETKVEANKEYGWTFTPADTDNYEVLTGKAVVYTYYVYVPTVKPQVQTPEITPDAGASDVKLSEDGTKATVELKDGYKVIDVLVNGVSIGAVTELENLKTGDVVEIVTEPVVVDEMAEVALDADSKAVTMKSGKKAIKLTWHCDNDTDLGEIDGYEIFRSTKRYKGYGTKPFFVTTRNVYYNTKVEPGVKYYYKVRGFVEFEGKKYYTDWSMKAWRML